MFTNRSGRDPLSDSPRAPPLEDAADLPYRDPLPVVRERLAKLLRLEEARAPALAAAVRVLDARRARIAAAISGLVTLFVGVLAAVHLAAVVDPGPYGLDRHWMAAKGGGLTIAVLGSGALALFAWTVARAAYAVWPRRWRLGVPARTSDVQSDLARLEASDHVSRLLARAQRLECAGLALPAAAVALLMPLTLHLMVSPFFGSSSFANFDEWIVMSAVLVGHAHVMLVALAVRHARRIARREAVQSSAGWRALGWTVAAGCVPGLLLVAIPPIVVGLTGAVFVPWMFAWMTRSTEEERRTLAMLERGSAPAGPQVPIERGSP